MERIMEEYSFQAAEAKKGDVWVVDKVMVEKRLAEVTKNTDISRYIL